MAISDSGLTEIAKYYHAACDRSEDWEDATELTHETYVAIVARHLRVWESLGYVVSKPHKCEECGGTNLQHSTATFYGSNINNATCVDCGCKTVGLGMPVEC